MTDAVSGTRRGFRELADGTLRVQVDIDPQCKDTFLNLFRDVDMPLALAPLKADFERRPHGQYAKQLRQSGFFLVPDVWKAIGSDDEFLEWLRTQECCVCNGEPVEAAHVRRVANGAGMGIKPPYSAVPLCKVCHSLQHLKGESAIGGREFLDKQRALHVERWAWDTLKEQFGHAHWYDVPPETLQRWAMDFNVAALLPESAHG